MTLMRLAHGAQLAIHRLRSWGLASTLATICPPCVGGLE